MGVIGCGKIGRRHITAYKKFEDVDVYACDLDEPLAEETGEEYDIPWSSDYRSLIQEEKLDAIDICTPTPSHKGIIENSLDLGVKYFFCEKPLAGYIEEVKGIENALKEKNAFLTTGYLYRFHPTFEFIKEVLDEKIIGKPYLAIFRLGGRGSHRPWKHKKDSSGGSILDMMVHMIDLAQWYFGDLYDVEKLHEDTLLRERKIDGQIVEADAEDITLCKMMSSSGASIICESDLATPSYSNYVEILGTNGTIFGSILHYFPTIVFCKEPRGIYNQGHNFYEFPQTNLFNREMGYFLGCIRGKNSERINHVGDSLKIMEVVEELRRQ